MQLIKIYLKIPKRRALFEISIISFTKPHIWFPQFTLTVFGGRLCDDQSNPIPDVLHHFPFCQRQANDPHGIAFVFAEVALSCADGDWGDGGGPVGCLRLLLDHF